MGSSSSERFENEVDWWLSYGEPCSCAVMFYSLLLLLFLLYIGGTFTFIHFIYFCDHMFLSDIVLYYLIIFVVLIIVFKRALLISSVLVLRVESFHN